jgi:hypothetical protein
MSCCGGKRRSLNRPQMALPSPSQAARQRSYHPEFVTVEYTGRSGLTAFGPYSGRRYRFASPGAQVEVDGRDAPSLMAVPGLRRANAA